MQPQPVFLPLLQPGGVPPFCFQLALPWLKPARVPLWLLWAEWLEGLCRITVPCRIPLDGRNAALCKPRE